LRFTGRVREEILTLRCIRDMADDTDKSDTPRAILGAHAAACREAMSRGKTRPKCPVANLRGADLRSASLHDANLRGADLSGADLSGAKGIDDIPLVPVPGLAAKVLAQLEAHPETWDQEVWHSECQTSHCLAGWAVVLAGEAGTAAEKRLCTPQAAAMLLGGANHPFKASDASEVISWLRARVAAEVAP